MKGSVIVILIGGVIASVNASFLETLSFEAPFHEHDVRGMERLIMVYGWS